VHSVEGLLDVHERVHRNLKDLIAHCAGLPAGTADQLVEGFGEGTIRLRIHHMLGAERYWMSVLRGDPDAADDSDSYPELASLEELRAEIFESTRSFLASLDDAGLSTARRVKVWGGDERELRPADVFYRTQTHHYHHQGQVLALCRALGRPASGLDYPLL